MFWSPDSRFIGFVADGKLKKINIAGGSPIEIGDADGVGPGSWSRDGIILYSRNLSGGSNPVIGRIPDSGGEVKPVTEPSQAQGLQLMPQFLPDNRHFLYHVLAGRAGAAAVYVGSLDSKSAKPIARLEGNLPGSPVIYAPPGYLLFLRDSALVAQKFDIDRLELMCRTSAVFSTVSPPKKRSSMSRPAIDK